MPLCGSCTPRCVAASIPAQGSAGASGDLAPLAHLGAAEGERDGVVGADANVRGGEVVVGGRGGRGADAARDGQHAP